MSAQRKARRAREKSRKRDSKRGLRALEERLARAAYGVTPARLRIAVGHAEQERRAAVRLFQRFPNRETWRALGQAARTSGRVQSYASRLQQVGYVDLVPEGGIPGTDWRRCFGRALDEALLFFMEEERRGESLRLKLVRQEPSPPGLVSSGRMSYDEGH